MRKSLSTIESPVTFVRVQAAFTQPIFRLRIASAALAGLSARSIHQEIGQKDLEPLRTFIEEIEEEIQALEEAVETLRDIHQGGAR